MKGQLLSILNFRQNKFSAKPSGIYNTHNKKMQNKVSYTENINGFQNQKYLVEFASFFSHFYK
jgi:hypothetical protein